MEPDRFIGATFANCRIERLLGRGGMGTVYAARAPANAPVVIKFLAPEIARTPHLKARFQREGEALQKIRPHPNVVRVHGVHEDELTEQPFIVMEFVDGESLEDLLRREGRIAPDVALRIARDIALGLSAIHGHGLVHRDIKPANVLVRPTGQAKIVDLGLAKDVFMSGLTTPGQLLGTVRYMAPEQFSGGPVDPRCDVFALGATLYHLLAGRPPYPGDDVAAIADAAAAGDAAPIRSLVPSLSQELEVFLIQALHPEVDRRYPDADACAEDLERLRRGERPEIPCLSEVGGRGWFPLIPGRRFVIGSGPGCALPLTHSSVAPRHAQLALKRAGFVLSDLKSQRGTLVNGQPITRVTLSDRDLLTIGRVSIRFFDPLVRPRVPAYLRDAPRETQPAPVLDLLAELGDPRATVLLLEDLAPDPLRVTALQSLLTPLLGADVSATVTTQLDAARLAANGDRLARLRLASGEAFGPDPTPWLAWWDATRTRYPVQLGPGDPPASLHLRLIAGAPPSVHPVGNGHLLLIGRDEKVHLRLPPTPGVARLHATVIPLHRRLIVRSLDAQHPATKNGEPLTGPAFLDPGDLLTLGPVTIALETEPLPPTRFTTGTVIPAEAFDALEALAHPAVATGLLGILHEAKQPARLLACADAVFEAPAARDAFRAKLEARLMQRAADARALLPRLLGRDVGADPRAWNQLLAERRDQLPPQVLPAGWLSTTRGKVVSLP